MRETVLFWIKEGLFWVTIAVGAASILQFIGAMWLRLLSSVTRIFKVTHYVVAALHNSSRLLQQEHELEQKCEAAHEELTKHMEDCYECKNEQTWCDDGKPLYRAFNDARFQLQLLITSLNKGK